MTKPYRFSFNLAVLFSFILLGATQSRAGDWPTYLKGNDRVGSSSELLTLPLSLAWSNVAPEKAQQAWPGPDEREFERKVLRRRNNFDDAFHVAIVGQRLYYGSSVDHQLRCVDLETGSLIWTFFTEGSIRLSPTVYQGKVYVGSDDGYAYCLTAETGKLVWKMRPGPSGERILGRQQMVSRWPVRTGVTIQEDSVHGAVAYFGAGVFPHENIFLIAARASDGKEIWKIDNLSQTQAGRNDLSPQGYMLTTEDVLVVPSGRSLPAVFDRYTGDLLHKKRHSWRSDAGGVVGGTQALLADGQIYCWGADHIMAMDQTAGSVGFGWFSGHQMTISGDAAFAANGAKVVKIDRAAYAANSAVRHGFEMRIAKLNKDLKVGEKPDEIREEIKELEAKIAADRDIGLLWKTESPLESRMIVAGKHLIVGGKNEVAAFDTESGKQVWSAPVAGEASGLAVASGRLVVSTTSGEIICFSSSSSNTEVEAIATVVEPYPADDDSDLYRKAAEEILEATGVERGFCLVVGAGEGRLAYELAKRSDLEIYGIESDPDKVASAREKLSSAGYYGSRISIHHGSPDDIPWANYFANLIVSDTLIKTGRLPDGANLEQLARCVKPVGGIVCLSSEHSDLLSQLRLGEQSETRVEGNLTLLERGPLPGAGSWSHQYGEAGNTACSYDYLVKGGLGVLWYGDPGESDMVNRHDGAVAPLAINGRLIAQGESRIMAYDAYNGLFLWERDNPDSVRTGVFQNQNPGNLVASDDSLFFMEKEVCVELDAGTGEEIARHQLPEKAQGDEHQWGYVAYQDGILYGTATVRKELESKYRRRGRTTDDSTDGIFAIDVGTGKHLWHYSGGTIEHQTIAVGDGRIYFIDSSITGDERLSILRQDKARFANLSPEEVKDAEAQLKEQDLRLAVAIDSKTGAKLWSEAVDVTDCSEIGIGGGKLTLLIRNDVLVLCGANANGHYWKQFMAGDFSERRLVALSGSDGSKMWARDGNYRHRPIIVDDKIIAEPWSYDLYTGEQTMRDNPLTGQEEPWSVMRNGHHCGMLVGTPNMLAFRSGYTGFYDLEEDIGTKHFAGHRTGCWINAIPANGLISIPESSAGCVCLFSISSTIVMEPRPERKDWAMFSSTGAQTPIKHLAMNIGAPGDRRDSNGTAWLAFPRPRPERETGLDLVIDFADKFSSGGSFVSTNEDAINLNMTGAADSVPSWVYSSWGNGMLSASIPLLSEGDEPGKYTVRVHMASPAQTNVESKERIFNLRLQGEIVGEEIRIPAGNHSPVVREFKGVPVKDVLKVEQYTTEKDLKPSEMAVLNGIEIIREL